MALLKLSNKKELENNYKFKSTLSSLIKVSQFIEDVSVKLNMLPDDEQRKNFIEKYKKGVFSIDTYWYDDLSEEDKIQLQNVYSRY